MIAADRWPGGESEHAYEAARMAETTRQELIRAGRPFITETVFSHPSEVDLAVQAAESGYLEYLHVIMVPVEVTIGRVAHRVRHGGHDVPEHKIRERYERLWSFVTQARSVVDRTVFYDNENDRHPFRRVAVYEHGQPVGAPEWPSWTPVILR